MKDMNVLKYKPNDLVVLNFPLVSKEGMIDKERIAKITKHCFGDYYLLLNPFNGKDFILEEKDITRPATIQDLLSVPGLCGTLSNGDNFFTGHYNAVFVTPYTGHKLRVFKPVDWNVWGTFAPDVLPVSIVNKSAYNIKNLFVDLNEPPIWTAESTEQAPAPQTLYIEDLEEEYGCPIIIKHRDGSGEKKSED